MTKQLIAALIAGTALGAVSISLLTADEVQEGEIRISQITFRPRYFEGQASDGGTLVQVQVEACGEEKGDAGFFNAHCVEYIADAGSEGEIIGAGALQLDEVKEAVRAGGLR